MECQIINRIPQPMKTEVNEMLSVQFTCAREFELSL